jgi:hypothetical protein
LYNKRKQPAKPYLGLGNKQKAQKIPFTEIYKTVQLGKNNPVFYAKNKNINSFST